MRSHHAIRPLTGITGIAAITPFILCALVLTACDPGAGPDDGEPPTPLPQAVAGDVEAQVLLRWQSVTFQDPGAPQRILAGQPVGTLVPVADGVIDLAEVDPPFGLYRGICALAGGGCDAEWRDREARDPYALAALSTTDAPDFDCTFDAFAACPLGGLTHAPSHLLLFVDEAFEAGEDPYLGPTGIEGMVEPGVHLVVYRSKRDMSLLPLDAEAARFVLGGDPPNLF